MRRDAAISTIIGAVVGAVFGRVWLSWAGTAVPGWQSELDIAGWLVFALFVLAGVLIMWRVIRGPEVPVTGDGHGPPKWGWFPVVIVVEVALVAGGQSLLNGQLDRPEWIPVWTMVIIGAHFVPFGLILRVRAFHVLAGALCAVAAVTALAAVASGSIAVWFALPGFGGAACLWAFAGWALSRVAAGRWAADVPSSP